MKERRKLVHTYIFLVDWTDQGVTNVRETVERLDRGAKAAEKYGVRLRQTYWALTAPMTWSP